VIKHKYIGAKWSVVCTNVLVHYLKGSFMFLSHCLFVRTLAINLAGESGKGNSLPIWQPTNKRKENLSKQRSHTNT
jgi:hypothetical protein